MQSSYSRYCSKTVKYIYIYIYLFDKSRFPSRRQIHLRFTTPSDRTTITNTASALLPLSEPIPNPLFSPWQNPKTILETHILISKPKIQGRGLGFHLGQTEAPWVRLPFRFCFGLGILWVLYCCHKFITDWGKTSSRFNSKQVSYICQSFYDFSLNL